MIGKVGKCCQMWGIPSFSRGRGVVERGTPGKMLNIKAGNIIMSGQRMVSVQIFGLKNSPATRAAERVFKERRVTVHMVDLRQKPLAPGEVKRFIDRKSTRLNSSHLGISYAVFCLKKKKDQVPVLFTETLPRSSDNQHAPLSLA